MKPIILLSAFLFLICCKNDDDNQNNCGCNSTTITSIQQIEGTVYSVNSQNENTPPVNFVIVRTDPEMPGWQTSYYACNDDLINDLGEIPETGTDVIFSGNTKELCEDPISIPEHFHYQIELNQISLP